jgi:hypothetical protein
MAGVILFPTQTDEDVVCALGHAVAKVWSQLPQDVQHQLFEEAVASQAGAGRQQLAVFLHHRHHRTSESLKARAIPEPDSLGG